MNRSRVAGAHVVPVLVLSLLVLLGHAGPASAHSAANSPASNFVSTLRSITPLPPGFRAAVIEGGSRVELRWRSGPEVSVPGYEGEPYLRVGENGVFENQRSPAVAVNRTRTGSEPDPNADAAAAPLWRKLSSKPVVRWHDHRVHYMGSERPPSVRDDPKKRQVIHTWVIPIQAGTARHSLNGDLVWVPGPSAAPFLVVAGVLAAALGALGVLGPTKRSRAIATVIGALGVLVIVDVIHLIGIVFGVKGGVAAALGRLFTVGYGSIAAWIAAVAAIVLLRRSRDDALYLAVFAGALMAVVGGLVDVGILSRTSLVFAFAPAVARWCVAATLGLGVGISVAGVLLTRPNKPSPAASAPVGMSAASP